MSAWESSSAETDKVIAAFVAALGDLSDIVKDRKATLEGKGDKKGFSYTYADLASAMEQARPVLKAHDLAVSQPPSMDGQDVVVATVILHTSGQWLAFPTVSIPAGPTAQNKGSAISYARRYSLMAILGMATEDDDGAGAGERQAPVQRPTVEEQTFSAEAVALMREVAALKGTPAADAVKAFAQSRGRRLIMPEFEDAAFREDVRNAIDEAKHSAGVEQPELAAQQ